jgi:hypothetical protein
MAVEPCSGCGEMSAFHPIVGVARDKEAGRMAAFPVCLACWKDPAHRKFKLKMHFFPRRQADQAVRAAGADSIGG